MIYQGDKLLAFAIKPIIFHLCQKYFLRPLMYQHRDSLSVAFCTIPLSLDIRKMIRVTQLCLENYFRISKSINKGWGDNLYSRNDLPNNIHDPEIF